MAGDGIRLEIEISQTGRLVYGKVRLKKLMRQAGGEIAALARALIRGAQGGGRSYYGPQGKHVASAPGEPPVSVTGKLAGSIKMRPFKSGEGVAVRETAFYALFLAAGAKGGVGSGRVGVRGQRNKRNRRGEIFAVGRRVLLPRPSLTAALEQREISLAARVQAAVLDDIEFRRIKPGAR
jgi:hypothetical protein